MHYKDGTEAKIGDIVKGVPYNNGGKTVVGQLIQATPGSDSCNLIVAFTEIYPLVKGEGPVSENLHCSNCREADKIFTRKPSGLTSEDAAPTPHALNVKYDYGRVGDFELVYRPE